MFEIKSLKEEAGGIASELKELASTVANENRNMSEEEIQRFDSLEAKKADIESKIKTAERVQRVQNNNAPAVVRSLSKSIAPTRQDFNLATKAWLLSNSSARYKIERSWLDSAERCGIDMGNESLILRTDTGQDLGTTGQGPELIDGSIFQAVAQRLKAYGGVRKVAKVIQTENGNPIHWAYSDDTSNSAAIVGENTTVTSVPQTFSKVVLGAYSFKTDVYPVSLELVQDAMIDIVAELGDILGIRLGRGMNAYLTTGTGSSQPKGVVAAATAGVTSAASGAISYADINNLFHALDPEYRDSPNCAWMMSDGVMGYLEQNLIDSSNRPLWLDSNNFSNYTAGAPKTLLGRPVIVNNQMASSVTASAKAVLFGDFSRYVVRDVALPNIMVLRERFMDQYALGVLAFARIDANAVDANALQLLTVHA